jgi:CP family cyanate transporter-like MFS transporter
MENIRAKPTTALWLMISVVLVALNLRPSMAAVGPLLSSIRADVPLSFSSAALLTMLPVMAMGLAMFFGMGLAKRVGEHRSIVLSLLVIGLATLSRLVLDSALELIVSAIAAGMGIAMIQALMPALIKSRFSDNVSLFMGLYVTAIMGGAALAASFAPFVQLHTGSWRIGLAIWTALALLALVFWWAQRSALPPLPQAGPGLRRRFSATVVPGCWRSFRPRYRVLHLCAGVAGAVLRGARLEEQNAGLLLGFLTAMEVVSGLITPAIANRRRDKRGVVAVLLVLIILGFCGLILSPQHPSLLWPCLLGLGIGGLFPMSLILSLDHLDNPRRAGGLTAFVQGIGYLIAGLSPLIAGMIRDRLGSFEWAWWSLTAVIVVMLLIVTRFDPRHYARHIR